MLTKKKVKKRQDLDQEKKQVLRSSFFSFINSQHRAITVLQSFHEYFKYCYYSNNKYIHIYSLPLVVTCWQYEILLHHVCCAIVYVFRCMHSISISPPFPHWLIASHWLALWLTHLLTNVALMMWRHQNPIECFARIHRTSEHWMHGQWMKIRY